MEYIEAEHVKVKRLLHFFHFPKISTTQDINNNYSYTIYTKVKEASFWGKLLANDAELTVGFEINTKNKTLFCYGRLNLFIANDIKECLADLYNLSIILQSEEEYKYTPCDGRG